MRTGGNRLKGDGWICLQKETGMKGGISLRAGNRQRNCNRRLPMGRQNRSSGVKAVLMPAISAAND